MGSQERSVVYVSEAKNHFDERQLVELADSAAENNKSLQVTGFLHFASGRFVQYLEGDQVAVKTILEKISQDTRHQVTATAWEQQLTKRRFPRWAMRWIRSTEMTEIKLEGMLADHVLFCVRAQLEEPKIDHTISRMLMSIAKLHGRK